MNLTGPTPHHPRLVSPPYPTPLFHTDTSPVKIRCIGGHRSPRSECWNVHKDHGTSTHEGVGRGKGRRKNHLRKYVSLNKERSLKLYFRQGFLLEVYNFGLWVHYFKSISSKNSLQTKPITTTFFSCLPFC